MGPLAVLRGLRDEDARRGRDGRLLAAARRHRPRSWPLGRDARVLQGPLPRIGAVGLHGPLRRLVEVRPQHAPRRMQRDRARSQHPAHANAGNHEQDLRARQVLGHGYAQGLIYLIFQHDKTHFWKTELAGTAVYFTWVFAVALSMPTWAQTVGWVMVSHAVAGILHVQIVLSHWSMHSYEGRAYTGADDEWYITQLRTTMNVATDPLLDWTHIGLQFQVEHHLFPRLPRHNLRIAREMVREVVDKHFPPGSEESKRLFPLGAAYHEPGFFAGNVEMWHALKKAAYAARSAKKGEHGFWECALWDVVNCVG